MKTLRCVVLFAALAGFTLAGVAQFTTNSPVTLTPAGSDFTTNSPDNILPPTASPKCTNVYFTNGVFVFQGISTRSRSAVLPSSFIDIYAKSNGGSYGLYYRTSLTSNRVASITTTALQTNRALQFSNWQFALQYEHTNTGTFGPIGTNYSFSAPAPTITEDTSTVPGEINVAFACDTAFNTKAFTASGQVVVYKSNGGTGPFLPVYTNNLTSASSLSAYDCSFNMSEGPDSFKVRIRNGSVITPFSNTIVRTSPIE